MTYISIHVLRVEDDRMLHLCERRTPISIHVLRVEDDARGGLLHLVAVYFNPRPPCGGRPNTPASVNITQDFNPRPPCGGRHLAGAGVVAGNDFNPRPPCGGRPRSMGAALPTTQFQSTSSVWRTTKVQIQQRKRPKNFNPRPPCGGRRAARRTRGPRHGISIHVLRVEDDLSASPAVEAEAKISIHVLRVEDDFVYVGSVRQDRHFNPRPPCGGRLELWGANLATTAFQSTSSVWRTTVSSCSSSRLRRFQSTSSVWRTTRPKHPR